MPSSDHGERDSSDEFAGFSEEELVPIPTTGYSVTSENEIEMTTEEKELKIVTRQRDQVRQRVVSFWNTVAEGNPSLAQLTWLKSKVSSAYQEYNDLHRRAMALISDEKLPEQQALYENFETSCDLVSTKVEELLLAEQKRAAPETADTKPQVIIQQQPLKAPIPKFDGSYASWPKFKAIFQDLMANSSDSDAMKLYHLDQALGGEAEGMLGAKIINEGNYTEAWAILTEQFENKRVIVESHLRALLSLQRMTSESYKELRSLLNEVTRNVESLRYQQQEMTGLSEHLLVFLVTNALDPSTRKAWESKQQKGELPKYEPTIKFLTARAQILQNCEMAVQTKIPAAQKCHAASARPPASETACDFCGGPHGNFQCSTLTSLSTSQRREKVRVAGLCFNCLRKGHLASGCPSSKTCRTCEARHNTLLHDDTSSKSKASLVAAPVDNQVSASCSGGFATRAKTVLLPTAVVDALDKHGRRHPCRVLLDSGSQVNFVTEELVNRLGIKKHRANVPITGINELQSHARDKVVVKFRSRVSPFASALECLVTPKVTGNIPTRKIDVSGWRLPEAAVLADPAFHIPGKVDMIIGGELFFDILKPRYLRLSKNLPQLRETHLGWIVTGVFKESQRHVEPQHSNVAIIEVVETSKQLSWQDENEQNAPQLFTETACGFHSLIHAGQRDSIGKFEVHQQRTTKETETNQPVTRRPDQSVQQLSNSSKLSGLPNRCFQNSLSTVERARNCLDEPFTPAIVLTESRKSLVNEAVTQIQKPMLDALPEMDAAHTALTINRPDLLRSPSVERTQRVGKCSVLRKTCPSCAAKECYAHAR